MNETVTFEQRLRSWEVPVIAVAAALALSLVGCDSSGNYVSTDNEKLSQDVENDKKADRLQDQRRIADALNQNQSAAAAVADLAVGASKSGWKSSIVGGVLDDLSGVKKRDDGGGGAWIKTNGVQTVRRGRPELFAQYRSYENRLNVAKTAMVGNNLVTCTASVQGKSVKPLKYPISADDVKRIDCSVTPVKDGIKQTSETKTKGVTLYLNANGSESKPAVRGVATDTPGNSAIVATNWVEKTWETIS
jgi:hypothetical protein